MELPSGESGGFRPKRVGVAIVQRFFCSSDEEKDRLVKDGYAIVALSHFPHPPCVTAQGGFLSRRMGGIQNALPALSSVGNILGSIATGCKHPAANALWCPISERVERLRYCFIGQFTRCPEAVFNKWTIRSAATVTAKLNAIAICPKLRMEPNQRSAVIEVHLVTPFRICLAQPHSSKLSVGRKPSELSFL